MRFAIQSLPFLWQGLLVTLHISALIVFFSLLAGTILGIGIVYGPRWLYWPIRLYSDFFRGIPLLVLIFFMYYGLPAFKVNLTNFDSVVLALSAFESAHIIEVVRGAIQSIPRGQTEAAKSIGLTAWQRLLSVRLPTMFRVVLPSLSNAYVSLFKDTSLASVIAVPELTYGAQWIKTNSFRVIETWAVVTPMYLVTGYALLFALQRLERRFAIH